MRGLPVHFPPNQGVHSAHAGVHFPATDIVEQSAGAQRDFHVPFAHTASPECGRLGIAELKGNILNS